MQQQREDEEISAHFRLPQLLKLRENEFLKLTENFSSSNIISRGYFTTVYKGVFPNGLVVAVKKLELTKEIRSMGQKNFFTELHVLSSIRHRNILPILGYFSNLDTMALILAFMPKGSLHSKLQRRHSYICLDWSKRYKIALGVAEALTYMHNGCKQQIVHCDLNPSNILLDDDFEAHIGNFGFAKTIEQHMRLKEGFSRYLWTPGYTAPELFSGEKPSPEADVYSFGIILLQLLTRRSPTSAEFCDGLTLREWCLAALQEGNWTNVLDMQLRHEIICQSEMLSVMEMAISCCNEEPAARPCMKAINVLIQDSGSWESAKQTQISSTSSSFTHIFTLGQIHFKA